MQGLLTPHAPHYALEDGKIVYKGDCNEGANLLLREWLENSAAYRWLIDPYRHQLNHDDVDVYVSTLEAAVKLAKDKYGVPTLIPYLRVPPEYLRKTGFTDDAIMARLRDAGAIVIDASLDAQKCRRGDQHSRRRTSDASRQSPAGRDDHELHQAEYVGRPPQRAEVTFGAAHPSMHEPGKL